MKFKHYKEAEARSTEIKGILGSLNTEITAIETEARSEETGVEKRETLITSLSGKIAERDRLTAEQAEADQEAADLRGKEQNQFGLLANLTTGRVHERAKARDQNDDVLATRQYELAYAQWLRSGDNTELRAIVNTTTDASGGYLVPTTLANIIADKAMIGGRLVALCNQKSIKGSTEYPIVASKTDPGVHPEQTALSGATSKLEKTVVITSVDINPQFIAEILRTTDKFEADTIEAFWSWLVSELPDAIMRKLDRLVLNGLANGTEGIRGILTNTNTNMVATLPTHTLNFNSANQAVALLDDGMEDQVAIAMNRKTFFNTIMGLQGTDGHPIYTVMNSNLNRPAYFFGGYPVAFTSELPEYATATAGQAYMVVGNWQSMVLNFPLGMAPQVTRDPITEAHLNFVRYISKIYVGGNVVKLGGFTKVTK